MTQPTAAQAAKRKPRQEAIENLAVRYAAARAQVAEAGICIKHFRPAIVTESMELRTHNGGITVAYRQLKSDSFVEISTAMCSRQDVYNRHAGTVVAVEQFMNERRIRVPVFGVHPADVVELMFRDLVTAYATEQ